MTKPYPFAFRLGVCAASLAAAQACYNYVPVETAPSVGERVAFEITDRGRVQLADRFGPGIESIDGRVLEINPTDYVINVYRVMQINGSSAIWTGEQSRIGRDVVGSIRRRELSKGRTALLVGGIAAGVIALTARGLAGSGNDAPDSGPTTPPPQSIRIPIFFHP
jgi:hypothetical protein